MKKYVAEQLSDVRKRQARLEKELAASQREKSELASRYSRHSSTRWKRLWRIKRDHAEERIAELQAEVTAAYRVARKESEIEEIKKAGGDTRRRPPAELAVLTRRRAAQRG